MISHAQNKLEDFAQPKGESEALIFEINKNNVLPNVGVEYIVVDKGKRVKRHYHKKARQIVIVVSGKGFAVLGKKEFSLKKGTILTIPEKTPHSFRSDNETLEMVAIQTPGIQNNKGERDTVFFE